MKSCAPHFGLKILKFRYVLVWTGKQRLLETMTQSHDVSFPDSTLFLKNNGTSLDTSREFNMDNEFQAFK